MPNAWDRGPTQDKLDIFVSSRLQECSEERTAARSAIRSINHNPVLFEHIGARSIKPRQLYLSRLRDSQLMVAIHRLGYGYVDVAGGMDISGLEDEFVFARDNGIPTLLYVYSDPAGRDERLAKLIEEASPNVTIWFYDTPQELEQRIRDDLTAEITRFVLRPEVASGALAESSEDLLQRAEKRQGTVIDRPAVLEQLSRASRESSILDVVGRAGIGKTTLVAQFAEKFGGAYVRVAGLAPLDVFTVCARAISPASSTVGYSTLQGAMLGFSSAWAERDETLLIVDECEFISELARAIEMGGGTSSTKRLVVTSRNPHGDLPVFEVPVLEPNEVEALLGTTVVEEGRDARFETPLEIQAFLTVADDSPRPSSSTGREVISYLALSPAPLGADELLKLLGDDSLTIEALYEQIATVSRIVDDSPAGFRIVHEDTAEQMRTTIKETPQRLRFYVNRLETIFQERGDFRSSYRLLSLVGDGSEAPYAQAALRQSAKLGDFRFGRAIAEKLLEEALDTERRSDALDLTLMLVYPMELMGDVARAAELLARAEKLAEQLGEEERASVAEVSLASRARRTLAAKDVEGLEEARNQYKQLGAAWDHARLGLELSALYIAGKAYEKAVEVLRPTLQTFREISDEYGVDLAERNLAASLASIPGSDAEVDQLVSSISERAGATIDPRRQHAWYNNILSRRYRAAGRYDDAERVTRETIQISVELGEESLTALTYINLGNVLRDKKDLTGALEAYAISGTLAQHCGRRDIEADSSRLRAGMLNDFEEIAAVVPDRIQQAKVFAEHAIGLLKGTIYHEALARSYVELADAESSLGHDRAAAFAYFRAADEFPLVPDEEGYDAAIIRATEHALDAGDVRLYLDELQKAFGGSLDPSSAFGDQFIELIEPILLKAPKEHLVRILARHLATVRDELPPLLRPVLIEQLSASVRAVAEKIDREESWRVLFTGLLSPHFAQDSRGFDVHRRFAKTLSNAVEEVTARFTDHDDALWTVVLNFGQRLTISILTMDNTSAVAAASQALAVFFKAFEREIGEILAGTAATEVGIQVASFDEMAPDLREITDRMFQLSEVLREQGSAVTRTDDYSGKTPTMVFLGTDFLEKAVAGKGVGGSMQTLIALTLVEVIHQCFKGQVDDDEIRPKIVSIVRRTMS